MFFSELGVSRELTTAGPRRGINESTARRIAVALAALAGAIGAVYLGLWLLGIPPRWSAAGFITTKTNTALAILLASVALLLLGAGRARPGARVFAILAAVLVALIGGATLVERVWRVDLGIDQLIASEPLGARNSPYANRMGFPPAVAFSLLGLGLLALAARRAISRWFAAAVCLVALVPTVGFTYGIGQLHANVSAGMCVSWSSLVGISALGLSLWIMDPRDGSLPVLYHRDQGGLFLRRTLLLGVLMPILFGFVALLGERWGLYGQHVGTALLVLALTTALLVLLWRSARWLSIADAERSRAHDSLQTANERLREEERRKDEFLSVLSHELRNPLAPIRNSLYILAHADPAGPQARRARDVIDRQATQLTRLVDDLLDLTRVARGRIELRRKPLDLVALARRTAEDHRALLQARGLFLALDLASAPVIVKGDETRLTQVLGNLLSNAAKFTPAGGRVTITASADGARATLHVRDTGPGIPPALQSAVFEPFVQARSTLARSEGGLGLGLALVKELVTLHGGAVSVEGVGGADFTITLPLATLDAAAATRESGRARDVTHRHQVLVVEDNLDTAQTLAELVSMLGHDVRVVHDGPSALERANALHPDVVLCDIGLPGMDGYEVARRLRAACGPWMRIIALSGYAQPDDVARALEAGFDVHVPKPPDPERLAGILG